MRDSTEQEFIDTSENQFSNSEEYIQYIKEDLYAQIELRERMASGLFFLICQVGSTSISWLLFSLQVTISIIIVFSLIVSCLPAIADIKESIEFSASSKGWEVSAKNALPVTFKFVVGGLIGRQGIQEILLLTQKTEENINQTYAEIAKHENPNAFVIPSNAIQLSLLVVLSVLVVGFVAQRRKSRFD